MRRLLIVVALALMSGGITAGALAANVHFKHGSPVFTDKGLYLNALQKTDEAVKLLAALSEKHSPNQQILQTLAAIESARKVVLQREERRDEHERQTGHQPMREALRRGDDAQRRCAKQHLLERSVGVIGGKKATEREQGRKERRDPDHAGADGAQKIGLGTHAEREEARHDDEEEKRGADVASPAKRKQEVAVNDPARRVEHQASSITRLAAIPAS